MNSQQMPGDFSSLCLQVCEVIDFQFIFNLWLFVLRQKWITFAIFDKENLNSLKSRQKVKSTCGQLSHKRQTFRTKRCPQKYTNLCKFLSIASIDNILQVLEYFQFVKFYGIFSIFPQKIRELLLIKQFAKYFWWQMFNKSISSLFELNYYFDETIFIINIDWKLHIIFFIIDENVSITLNECETFLFHFKRKWKSGKFDEFHSYNGRTKYNKLYRTVQCCLLTLYIYWKKSVQDIEMKSISMWKRHRKTITKKNANEKMYSGSQQSLLTVRWHFH